MHATSCTVCLERQGYIVSSGRTHVMPFKGAGHASKEAYSLTNPIGERSSLVRCAKGLVTPILLRAREALVIWWTLCRGDGLH